MGIVFVCSFYQKFYLHGSCLVIGRTGFIQLSLYHSLIPWLLSCVRFRTSSMGGLTSPSTAGNLREVADEPLVEVHKPYEGLDILDFCWLWPFCDSLDLNGVHCYMVLRDIKPKVVHLSTFKLAFLQSEE